MATKQSIQKESAVIGLQGTILRSRIPTHIIIEAGGEDGDAFEWVVTGTGRVAGRIVKGGAELVKEERKVAQREKLEQVRATQGAKKAKADPLGDAFGVAPKVAKPKAKAPAVVAPVAKIAVPAVAVKREVVVAPKPVPVVAPVRRVAPPIAKPSAKKAAKKASGVRFTTE